MKKPLLLIIIVMSTLACICVGSTQTSSTPRETSVPPITVNSGKLKETIRSHSGNITKSTVINVRKMDGTLDTRKDDLKELCLDFNYYQAQIIKHTAEGNTSKADDARTAWKQINTWLEVYNYDDVAYMFTLIKEKGW